MGVESQGEEGIGDDISAFAILHDPVSPLLGFHGKLSFWSDQLAWSESKLL